MELFSLEGKTALVTGSSEGIGFALANGLAEAGARIIINGRDTEKLSTAAKELGKKYSLVDQLPFDVTDYKQVQERINYYHKNNGQIDILVNNVGMQHRGPLEDFPVEMFEKMMRTNVSSIFNVGQAVGRHMIERGNGKIVNIASVQSMLARPGIAPYTATKGAVANLTKGMATDWAGKGIQVNAIAPGYFETRLTSALVADPEFSAWLKERTPAGRWGQVEELVGVCIFLSSAASSFVNGQTIYVDGGITASL